MNLQSEITEIKGIGDKSRIPFEKLNIHSVNDLIYYFPRSYEHFEKIISIDLIQDMERCAVFGKIAAPLKMIRAKGMSVITGYVKDDKDDVMEIKIYNMPFLTKTLKAGSEYVFRGFVRIVKGIAVMSQPKIYSPKDYMLIEDTIGPVYSLTKDLSNEKIKKAIAYCLDTCRLTPEYMTEEELTQTGLMRLEDALNNIHRPSSSQKLDMARRRLVFDEFAAFLALLKAEDAIGKKIPNENPMIETAANKRLEESLPYSLTNSQKSAVNEIINDMTGKYSMNRLVQGDVGSGKTIVAIQALLLCAENGYQGVMMAPTEVLARQHYENIRALSDKYQLNLTPVLLTGKMSSSARRDALANIKSGLSNVILGTHALFQEGVDFNRLALVITDEQHRFGVKQREELRNKGINPHILVMSATPIPRTLAMIIYGNLDISVMRDMPKNRIPIMNCVVGSKFRKKTYELIRKEVSAGHQAYVICPMVEENEDIVPDLKDVKNYSKELADYFGDTIRVEMLHGKMKPAEKTEIMERFKEKFIDVLVSTTVVEVGIDVSNATVIMIENAERFGLSQLHQLRGRVGRGDAQSYCVLVSDSHNPDTIKRLEILNKTNDGFEIAEADMRQRGPGELSGVRQSGEIVFSLANIINDSDVFLLANEWYERLSDRINNMNVDYIDFRTI